MNVLVVTDCQKDSIVNEQDNSILKKIIARLELAAQNSEFIVPTVYTNPFENGFYKNGTEGWEMIPEVKNFSPISINRETPASIEMARLFYGNSEVDSIEIIGFNNDTIIANAITIKSFRPDVSIGVNLDCCRPFDASLSELLVSCGIELVGGETSNMEG